MKPNAIKTSILLLSAVLLWGCGSSRGYLINDPVVMLAYKQDPSQEKLQTLADSYSFRISNATLEGKAPQFGLYAEYAVYLAMNGHQEEAKSFFQKEMEQYPCSDKLLRQVQYHLIPSQLTAADTQGIAFRPIVERPEDTTAQKSLVDAGDDETNTVFSTEQKVSQKDKSHMKKMAAKEKKKAQKQKAKAKKHDKKMKAKAKKKEQKAKAKEKKINQKAKEKLKKEKAKEKKTQKKAKEAERKAIKKAKKAA